jgi:hypothetical protein
MSHKVLDDIAFEPDMEELASWLRVKPESKRMDELQEMVAAAQAVARPKAT